MLIYDKPGTLGNVPKEKAFTLVEILIASAIFLVVVMTIYSAFHTGVFGYRNIQETIDTYQNASRFLEQLNLDLRNSFAYSKEETRFVGNKGDISFLTLVNTFTQGSISPDYALVSYKVQDNILMRLCRRNKESLNEKSEIKPEEIASDLQDLSFTYGYIDPVDKTFKFKDSWGLEPDEQKNFPQAVKVKLTLKNKAEFQRTIYLANE